MPAGNRRCLAAGLLGRGEWRTGAIVRRVRHDRPRCLFRLPGRAQNGGPGAGVPRLSRRKSTALAFLARIARGRGGSNPANPVACRLPHGWHATLCVVWENRRCILRSLAAGGFPSSPTAIVAPSAVPLWKVIVGPRADKLQPDPQGSGFSLGSVDESLASRASVLAHRAAPP